MKELQRQSNIDPEKAKSFFATRWFAERINALKENKKLTSETRDKITFCFQEQK